MSKIVNRSDARRARVSRAGKLDRREFLTAAGGLLLAFTLDGTPDKAWAQGTPSSDVNAFIRVGGDETVTILIGGGEMGQGIYSGLAQVAAEELFVDWSQVRAEPITASKSWLTGGSSGIRGRFTQIRTAAAAAREMLIAAAAKSWNVSPSACKVTNGVITNTATGQTLTYGSVASLAATMPVPTNPPLVPPSEFKVIGQRVARLDLPGKVTGKAKFGIDIKLPNMVFAVIKHCPTIGGTLRTKPALPAGALAIVGLDNAVAVVASNTWKAMQIAKELAVSWNIPSNASSIDSAVFWTQAQQLMAGGTPIIAEQAGNVPGAFANAAKVVEATYQLPYLAHCCMEVLSCTVKPGPGTLEIWAPTQAPNMVLGTAASISGLPATSITVHPTFMGGGLGRKFEQDYVAQAIRVALALGKPVKLTWPREEDMQHDQYRPMALARVRAAVDGAGNITGWAVRNVSPSILGQRGWVGPGAVDSQAVEGAWHLPYAFGSRLVEWVRHPAPVPVGFWRSVGSSINGFVVESALDEVAAATGMDPYQLRRKLLANNPRSLAVLDTAASIAGWSSPAPLGRARGIALCESFGSIVAQVAEVSQPVAGTIRVHKVACVIDCGTAVNPDSVEAQMQGGIHHGLSAALWGQVTFKSGRAGARNFSNYRVIRMAEAPAINVKVIQSGAPLGGVGEPGVPPIGPAVANAYFALKGVRVRSLPFFPGATMGDG